MLLNKKPIQVINWECANNMSRDDSWMRYLRKNLIIVYIFQNKKKETEVKIMEELLL